MLEEIKKIKCEKSDIRNVGITVGIILLIISGFLLWKEKESYQIFSGIGITLSLIAIAIPSVLKPVYWMWMVFATILGGVMTRIILSLLFYIILTPIGLISRLFGRKFLELKWNHSQKSYWNMRTREIFNKNNHEKQF